MIQQLVGIVLILIICGLIWWVVEQLIPIPEPFRKAIYVILVIIVVLVALHVIVMLAQAAGLPVPQWAVIKW